MNKTKTSTTTQTENQKLSKNNKKSKNSRRSRSETRDNVDNQSSRKRYTKSSRGKKGKKQNTRQAKAKHLEKKSRSNYVPKQTEFEPNVRSSPKSEKEEIGEDFPSSSSSEDDGEEDSSTHDSEIEREERKKNTKARNSERLSLTMYLEHIGSKGMKFFHYHIKTPWMWFFVQRQQQQGFLPVVLIDYLTGVNWNLNTMSFTHYIALVKSDKLVRTVASHYQYFGYTSQTNFFSHYIGYYYEDACIRGNFLEHVGHANSKFSAAGRLGRKDASVERDIPGFWEQLMAFTIVKKFLVPLMKVASLISIVWYIFKRFKQWMYPVQKHQLIPLFPKLSVYIEEVIKSFPYGCNLVCFLERWIYGNDKNSKWHMRSMSLPFKERVKAHMAINGLTTIPIDQSELVIDQQMWHLYGESYSRPNGVIESVSDEKPIPSFNIPRIEPDKVYDSQPEYELYNTTLNPNLYPQQEVHDGVWPLAFNVGEFMKPGNTVDNLFCAWDLRVSSWDDSVPYPYAVKRFTNVLKDLCVLNEDYDNSSWYSQLRARQKSNLEETESDYTEGITFPTLAVSVKSDEIIRKGVPRIIFHCQKDPFYKLGQSTHWITKSWASTHDENLANPFTVPQITFGVDAKPIQVAVVYTCGFTSKQLAKAFISYQHSSIDIMLLVMGDDSLAAVRKKDTQYYFACDFSRMDRTHSHKLRWAVEEEFGNTNMEWIKWRQELYRKTWVLKTGKHGKNREQPFMKRKDIDMLLTGEPGTSIMNSVTNAAVTSIILTQVCVEGGEFDIEGEYKKYGFITKGARLEYQLIGLDYLKGVFLLSDEEHVQWIRLPSFLCKFGKVLTNPKVISKERSPDRRSRELLWAQWLGYGDMATNWFYKKLDKLLRNKVSVELSPEVSEYFKLESWQITQDSTWITDEEWDSFMFHRYNLTHEDQEEFLEFFASVLDSQLPAVYSSEFIDALGRRDY